jgi:Rab-GTPase-TBC domain
MDDLAAKTRHLAKLLDSDAALDEPKLRLEAASGVPPAFRPKVWPLLLHAQRSGPLAVQARYRPLAAAFDRDGAVAGLIRKELRCMEGARSPRVIGRYLGVVGAYCGSVGGVDEEAVGDMVRIAAVVLAACEVDEDAFAVYCGVMRCGAVCFEGPGLDGAVRDFLMLFKALLPDLHEQFVDMDFDPCVWAVSALRSLLCRELDAACAARLLDCYLARGEEDWAGFHLHVCVALLAIMHERDEFNDIDSESLLPRLRELPRNLPVETIINRAVMYQQDSEADGFVRAGS